MKQAVIVVHGMGEQIPMKTLEGLVESVWTTDLSLTTHKKPVSPDKPRTENASWGKPDRRNHSYEVRRITTESARNKIYTDFFEFYWAHLMHGTTWEHVQAWIWGLLWRNPLTRVPKRVRLAWVLLWIIALCVIGAVLWGMLPDDGTPPSPARAIGAGVGALAVTAFVSNVLIKRFGDVARYVSAMPPNVARRQEIREKGVELLEKLMASKDANGDPQYNRIIVVAHSLGSIIAYDILCQLFARHNRRFDLTQKHPERHKLEQMIRAAAGLPQSAKEAATKASPKPVPLNIDDFQNQQAAAFAEARSLGAPWLVSDFVTLGSPLTHAEFLMAESKKDLRRKQARRILPTCPPALEHDSFTNLHHFTYAEKTKPDDPRLPHHAALFAYTRWTNLYSDHFALMFGDIISGPLGRIFGLRKNSELLSGIRDIAVLPAHDSDKKPASGMRRTLLTHNDYWDMRSGTDTTEVEVPHHIAALRDAIKLVT